MMGRWDRSHHVDPWPPENGIVGEWDVQDAEVYDDIEWIDTDWELNHAEGASLVPIESQEK